MSKEPGFGWRDIKAGEVLPSEYMFFDGQMWVHRHCSNLQGQHWEEFPNLERIKVKMTEEEIRAIPMTWELWHSMSVDDRFLYNRPAFEAHLVGLPVEWWSGLYWIAGSHNEKVDLDNPFRPYVPSPAPKWYLIKYPDGTVLGFDTEEKAQHAAIGQDVVLIVAQEVGE